MHLFSWKFLRRAFLIHAFCLMTVVASKVNAQNSPENTTSENRKFAALQYLPEGHTFYFFNDNTSYKKIHEIVPLIMNQEKDFFQDGDKSFQDMPGSFA